MKITLIMAEGSCKISVCWTSIDCMFLNMQVPYKDLERILGVLSFVFCPQSNSKPGGTIPVFFLNYE